MEVTVAIVEDDHDLASYLSILIEREGWTALVFHSGEEFVRFLDSGVAPAVAVALIDLMLPHITGFDLIVRAHERFPCIALSAADAASRRRALDLGAVTEIAKPFESTTLITLLKDLIATKDSINA